MKKKWNWNIFAHCCEGVAVVALAFFVVKGCQDKQQANANANTASVRANNAENALDAATRELAEKDEKIVALTDALDVAKQNLEDCTNSKTTRRATTSRTRTSATRTTATATTTATTANANATTVSATPNEGAVVNNGTTVTIGDGSDNNFVNNGVINNYYNDEKPCGSVSAPCDTVRTSRIYGGHGATVRVNGYYRCR